MCSWDTEALYVDCNTCGGDAGNDGYCLMCGSLVFIEEDDEEKK